MGQGQLRHGGGRRAGGIAHGDTGGFGVGHIDVVDAHTGPDNELQPGALGLFDVGGANFGGAANDHRVELPQGRAQLVRLIELFHDFMTVCPQLGYGLLIHTVGYENPHHGVILRF